MKFEDLKNPKLQEELKAAKSPEELLALAKEEGYELSDETLEAISGGWCPGHCGKDTCAEYCSTDDCGFV
ncbi:MAG: Nif11-like leader peptide family natural product precursor [Coriobacteriales bacterium]|nr:Nif11-like leader peptide family natural product precursor [Coriobacteriales bacterium]